MRGFQGLPRHTLFCPPPTASHRHLPSPLAVHLQELCSRNINVAESRTSSSHAHSITATIAKLYEHRMNTVSLSLESACRRYDYRDSNFMVRLFQESGFDSPRLLVATPTSIRSSFSPQHSTPFLALTIPHSLNEDPLALSASAPGPSFLAPDAGISATQRWEGLRIGPYQYVVSNYY
ncbi:hypothetical protein PLEOSDRAFT_163357 [Pleurotus ostreatus PC15]|uniref:Uncharacterized protein n=1 Tax=Pleurotus ostreatus (strain PC15) TaxID=1137138 RepID=A0A067N372_PLEO1|nr:hypothetical protein PLEOSDRAFT_163357 [Pleurotus ostreatus PC15]